MKLFCIPHAGGLGISFRFLKSCLADYAEVIVLELAGRGEKSKQPLYQSFEEAALDIYHDLEERILKEPYSILGHSMGSWLAYEVFHLLKKHGKRLPEHIFFSGNTAPPYQKKKNGIHLLPDQQFMDKILELGYTDKLIFSNTSLRDKFLPYLRSDLKITENYAADWKIGPVACGITVLYGRKDPMIQEDLARWSNFTEKSCDFKSFEGEHFFLYERADEVAEVIKKYINF